MHFPTEKTAHTSLYEPVVDHWLERKITQTANASTMQEDPNLYSGVLYHMSYVLSTCVCAHWFYLSGDYCPDWALMILLETALNFSFF